MNPVPWPANPRPIARLALTGLLLVGAVNAEESESGGVTSCVRCHGDAQMTGDDSLVRTVEQFAGGVHASVGLSCHNCHGGNPDPGLAEDMLAAMDPDHSANPYRGVPKRTGIPDFCGRCHSDPTYMKRFKPDARTDQQREYWTSRHGKLLKQGDANVAVCTDCHGVHGILRPSDPDSAVYPTQVAEMCRGCHSDPERMRGYTLDGSRPMPVNQYERWRRSVHAEALLEREELAAPTCNDCHGNHGATPPELESIAFVCGQCHPREAGLFRESSKQAGFEEHNESFLPTMGSGGCGECHGEPQSELTAPSRFSQCGACHDNHAVVRPSVALLGPLPATPCSLCHESPTGMSQDYPPEPVEAARRYRSLRDSLVEQARSEALEAEERWNFLVEEARDLPVHTEGQGAERRLRPEFARLFKKFRIGKTTFTYEDPASGEPTVESVRRCNDCHAAEPVLASEPTGLETARAFLHRMQELTVLTARAERILLAAQRGGVEVRDPLLQLDRAVDTQIELQVLVHTFETGEGSPFAEKHAGGMGYASAALEGGLEALEELEYRRQGLAVSLVIILLVLVGLAAKIRQISRDEEA